jgi:hypothetical protein
MKFILSLLLSLSATAALIGQPNTFSDKLAAHDSITREEQIYIHTDRPLYRPGETIWYSAFIVNASDFKPTRTSSIVYMEMLNPRGELIRKFTLGIDQGMAGSNWQIPSDAGGTYTLKAYTTWMKNQRHAKEFTKEVAVQKVVLSAFLFKLDLLKKNYNNGEAVTAEFNVRDADNKVLKQQLINAELLVNGKISNQKQFKTDIQGNCIIHIDLPDTGILNSAMINVTTLYKGQSGAVSRVVPVKKNKLNIQFMPESGRMIADLPSHVAYKAVNDIGKAADVEGVILDDRGNLVSSFKSFHGGMGAIDFTPRADAKYKAVMLKPSTDTFALPMVDAHGVCFHIQANDSVHASLKIYSSSPEKYTIMLRQREKLLYSLPAQGSALGEDLNIDLTNCSPGIVNIIIIDEKNIPLAERLLFVKRNEGLKVKVTPNKKIYSPNERAQLDILVTDALGRPVSLTYSLSVTDEKLHLQADDKQADIKASMLLTAELKGEVEEPIYYFDKTKTKAVEALDYVMLTHGWRRIRYEELMNENSLSWFQQIKYYPESFVISKNIYTLNGEKPAKGVHLRLDGTKRYRLTDSTGHFEFNDLLPNKTYIVHAQKGWVKQQFTLVPELIGDGLANPIRREVEQKMMKDKLLIDFLKPVEEKKPDLKNNKQAAVFDLEKPIQLDELQIRAKNLAAAPQLNTGGFTTLSNSNTVIMTQEGLTPTYQWAFGDIQGRNYHWVQPVQPFYISYNQISKVVNIDALPSEFYVPYATVVENGKALSRNPGRTLFWKYKVTTDAQGKSSFNIEMPHIPSTFRVDIQGISSNGEVVSFQDFIVSQLPVEIKASMPEILTVGDEVAMPVVLRNRQNKEAQVVLQMRIPECFGMMDKNQQVSNQFEVTIPADSFITLPFNYTIINKPGDYLVGLNIFYDGNRMNLDMPVSVISKGFAKHLSFTTTSHRQEFKFSLEGQMKNSVKARFQLYPSMVSDLLKTCDNMLRQPSGCFEQVSSSNYPNIAALRVMDANGYADENIKAKAKGYLADGYKKLAAYETPEGGFSLWGKAPASVWLTAWGLMQFHEMDKYDVGVSKALMDKTKKWLMNKLDHITAYNEHGENRDQALVQAYVCWVLSELGEKNIINKVYEVESNVRKSEDLYQMAMLGNTLYNLGMNDKAKGWTEKMKELTFDKKFMNVKFGGTPSYSGGTSLLIENLACVGLSMDHFKDELGGELMALTQEVLKQRGQYGFGSTQSTALALKLLEKASTTTSKNRKLDGSVRVTVNDQYHYEIPYNLQSLKAIDIDIDANQLSEGNNKVKVEFDAGTSIANNMFEVDWTSAMPAIQKECVLEMKCTFTEQEVEKGKLMAAQILVTNREAKKQPQALCMIGVPAGCQPVMKQLKELEDQKLISHFEIKNNYLVFYLDEMLPKEKRNIPVYFETVIPGSFEAPANSIYLYYTNEYKHWSPGLAAKVK